MEWSRGLYGWGVTDCQICFDYGVYYSPVSTPADFRFLAPVVLEQALKKAGNTTVGTIPFLYPFCTAGISLTGVS